MCDASVTQKQSCALQYVAGENEIFKSARQTYDQNYSRNEVWKNESPKVLKVCCPRNKGSSDPATNQESGTLHNTTELPVLKAIHPTGSLCNDDTTESLLIQLGSNKEAKNTKKLQFHRQERAHNSCCSQKSAALPSCNKEKGKIF